MLFLKRTKINLLIVFLFAVQIGFSQHTQPKHYGVLDGLPSNTIRCIYKDSRGLMWVGTDDGLCLFDGKTFTTFTEEDGLVGKLIWDIVEDKNHNLWFSCYANGLSMYDGTSFTNYTTENGLVHNAIRTLFIDDNNRLLIGTEDGLSIFANNTFWNYTPSKENYKRDFQVMQFFKKNNEQYLLSRTHGFYKINLSANFSVDSVTKCHSGFQYIEQNGNYLYSVGIGLHNGISNTHFNNECNSKTKISTDIIWDFQHTKNKTYIASWGVNENLGGLLKWNNDTLINVSQQLGINSKSVWSLFYDNQENHLWIGTIDDGLFVVNLSNPIIYSHLKTDNNIIDIETAPNSKWLLTSTGLIKITPTDTTFFNDTYFIKGIKNYIKIKPYLSSYPPYKNHFSKYFKSKIEYRKIKQYNNYIYVSTNVGLFQLSLNGNILEYYPIRIDDFILLKDGTLLHSRPYDNFYIYPSISDSLGNTVFNKAEVNTPKDINQILSVGGQPFLASWSKGLFVYETDNPKSFLNSNQFHHKNVSHLAVNNKGQLFIGVKNGTVYKAEIRKDFNVVDSIPNHLITGNTIFFIECFNDALLVGTNKGLNIIQNNTVRFLNEEQGLINRNFTSSKIKNDNLYIGTKNGLYTIHLPQLLKVNSIKENILISELSVNHKKIDSTNIRWFSYATKELTLPHNQNTIEITLKTNELYNNNKTKLRYQINNSNWITLDNNSLFLTNLASNNYNIKVEISNLLTGQKTIHQIINITIKKPYWNTLWFWFVIITLLAIITLIIYRVNIKRIKQQEQFKADLNKRIAETRIEALQSQMNPHFTFNAMNSIQNFIIDNNIDDALMYMGEFSKLIRQTLDNSSEKHILLDDEIDYLKTYTTLENMRFDNRIDVTFELNKINAYDVSIPPMLIQPLIENAFIHAFTDVERNYTLTVSFTKTPQHLICNVTDDGTGVDTTKTVKHTSKALKIIEERLKLLGSTQQSVTITSISTGTTSTITIPTQNG